MASKFNMLIASCILLIIASSVFCNDDGIPGGSFGADICRSATPQVWHLPFPGDSTKFIKCDINGGISTIYTCDSPLHFNPIIQVSCSYSICNCFKLTSFSTFQELWLARKARPRDLLSRSQCMQKCNSRSLAFSVPRWLHQIH